jgi:hypothetical protein
MKAGRIRKPEETRMEGKIKSGNQTEGKNLALMGMAGKLQIKKAECIPVHDWLMLQKNGKMLFGRFFSNSASTTGRC